VHPTQPAGGEQRDPGLGRDGRRGRDRGGPVDAVGRGDREIAHGQLEHVLGGGQPAQFVGVEPDDDVSVDHADGRRHGAVVTDCLLDLDGHVEVARPGQAVRDDRALQGDHRPAIGQCAADLRPVPDIRHDDHGTASDVRPARNLQH